MEGKLIMKKGFIFSLVAIFFVAVVILFFSLYISVYRKPTYSERLNLYEKNNYKFLLNNAVQNPVSTHWCSVHLVYDPDQDSSNQNIITKKQYCETYGEKRFI